MNMREKIAEELTEAARLLVAGVADKIRAYNDKLVGFVLKEDGGKVYVVGDTYPLKRTFRELGWKWDSGAKKWWNHVADVTEDDLDVLYDEMRSKDGKARKSRDEARRFLGTHQVGDLKVKVEDKGNHLLLTVVNAPASLFRDVKRAVYDVGGKKMKGKDNQWYWLYRYGDTNVGRLLDKVGAVAGEDERAKDEGAREAARLDGESWDLGRVSARLSGNTLQVSTSDKRYRDAIKGAFPSARWSGRQWEVPVSSITKGAVDSFLKSMADFERETEKELGPVTKGDVVRQTFGEGYDPWALGVGVGDVIRSRGFKTNADYVKVLDVDKRYVREDGMSFGVGKDSGHLVTISVRPATSAESAPARDEDESRASRSEAIERLGEIADKIRSSGVRPKGTYKPSGVRVIGERSKKMLPFGGGTWFVVGRRKIWFVRNNGADGDDWSLNNVETGGAGAIGWAVPRSEDLANEIESLGIAAGYEVA